MKKVFVVVIGAVATLAAAALLFGRLRFSAFVSFECAPQIDSVPMTEEAHERISRRVGNAVARYLRGIASRAESFLVRRPEFRENAVAISNALKSCQMEMAGGFVTNGAIADLRVSCGNAALARALADFVVRDFDAWLERQASLSLEKNTASDRVALERMRREETEPGAALLERLKTAERLFERERLKVRVKESPRIGSWTLAL